MQILPYTREHEQFRARVREFYETEVIPYIDDWEAAKQVPKAVWRKMGEQGFLCPALDKRYGGLGGDFLHSVIVIEELARTNHSGLFAALHSDIIVPYIDSYGAQELKDKYLPRCVSGEIITAVAMTEPDAGSDLSSIKTTAVEDGDWVVIEGSKTFISNAINCGLVVVAARDPEVQDPYQALSLYVVEDGTPGFKKGNKLDKMGMFSQDTAELFFTNCRIPKTNILGQKGQGFMILMEKLQQERLVCAIGAQAAAEFILEKTMAFCQQTQVAGKPWSKHQATQFALVEMATEVKLGRTFVDSLIVDHMQNKQVVVETSMAKYWTTDLAKKIVDQCLDLWGTAGALETCPLDRAFRDVRVMSIFAGTNEIMKKIAAKFMGL